MFFPLLEALLKKDASLSSTRIRKFMDSKEDPKLLFKAFFVYASQHIPQGEKDVDAVVFVDAVHSIFAARNDKEQLALLDQLIAKLVSLTIGTVDTSVLKPDPGAVGVVSVHDLEDAFAGDSIENMYAAVREVLQLMDNKQYFMEIMSAIALDRSHNSVMLTVAIWRAIEVLDWRNNFTPFLVHHLASGIFSDNERWHAKSGGGNSFEAAIQNASEPAELLFVSGLHYLSEHAQLLRPKIQSKIDAYLGVFLNSLSTGHSILNRNNEREDLILIHGALLQMPSIQPASELLKRIPLVV